MKRLSLITILGLTIMFAYAQIPSPPDPVCAYCGVDLKSQQAHKSSCPYYSEPSNEESSSSSSSNTLSSSSTSKPSEPTKHHPFAAGYCPECGGKVRMIGQLDMHRNSCRLGNAWRQYYYWQNQSFLRKKKKERDEALRKRDEAEREAENIADQAIKRLKSSSSSSSSSTSTPTTSAARIQLTYICKLCDASIKAYSIDEATKTFANSPWIHKSTCPEYKPQPGQNQSTKLKDYTPAPERPVVSGPLMEMPLRQPAPQFSGINETSIRHEKPVSIIGKHEWGEISEETLAAFESLTGEDIPRKFDIERYNHDKGTVILGTHMDNGRYHWTILLPQPDGSCKLISQEELKGDFFYGSQNVGELRDVHFEGEGTFVIAEYTSGYRRVFKKNGELFSDGYNIKVLGSMVEGKKLIYVGKDENTVVNMIVSEDGNVIVDGDNIEQYDDAIIVRNDNDCYLSNWEGDLLEIDNINSFEYIRAYNNQGSYYILLDGNKGYAVISRGFRRVGGWYKTEEEAHRAWRNYHP